MWIMNWTLWTKMLLLYYSTVAGLTVGTGPPMTSDDTRVPRKSNIFDKGVISLAHYYSPAPGTPLAPDAIRSSDAQAYQLTSRLLPQQCPHPPFAFGHTCVGLAWEAHQVPMRQNLDPKHLRSSYHRNPSSHSHNHPRPHFRDPRCHFVPPWLQNRYARNIMAAKSGNAAVRWVPLRRRTSRKSHLHVRAHRRLRPNGQSAIIGHVEVTCHPWLSLVSCTRQTRQGTSGRARVMRPTNFRAFKSSPIALRDMVEILENRDQVLSTTTTTKVERKLAGRADIEEALKKLDGLTQEKVQPSSRRVTALLLSHLLSPSV
ncbi:hypothetical protein EDB85DRAFT_2280718 [Lactarius pseudohatsudake]|nr:hypothetical protein EDB85DRAFT_2280718 [Lactarius pseudohatsudake]